MPAPESLRWIGSSKRDLIEMPEEVRRAFGHGLHLAQTRGRAPSAKPLKGFGAGVVELIEDHDKDTYRSVYTVKFKEAVYVLHCFKKKSKSGIATPREDLERIQTRVKTAEQKWKEEFGGKT